MSTSYLTTTWSPMMISSSSLEARVVELTDLKAVPKGLKSAVSHELTAKVLSVLFERPVEFNRVNLSLKLGDEVFAVVPNFRATEAREFTREEVEAAGFRIFWVIIVPCSSDWSIRGQLEDVGGSLVTLKSGYKNPTEALIAWRFGQFEYDTGYCGVVDVWVSPTSF